MERKYRHVIVVGIDGAGAFIREARTPCFDRIFAAGAVTYRALASRPTISAECWGSMLLGVGPEVHGLTNAIVSSAPYPGDSPFPSLFRRIRAALPQAKLGSCCNWEPITTGIVEGDLDIFRATGDDETVAAAVRGYIRREKPDFLFVQFDSVDGAGHENGYGTPAHLGRIQEVDALLGSIHEAAAQAGILEDTLFMAIADHGGTNPGNGRGEHGGWSEEEKYVTFAAAGRTVSGAGLRDMNIRDLAAVVLYALGIPAPDFREDGWSSQIPQGLFEDPVLPASRDISHRTGAAPRVSKAAHTSQLL